MEGRWDQESFLLPLPDADESTLATSTAGEDVSGAAHEEDGINVPALLAAAEDGSGDPDGDAAEEGAHLRVEIWQGKHCHGQVGRVSAGHVCTSIVREYPRNR